MNIGCVEVDTSGLQYWSEFPLNRSRRTGGYPILWLVAQHLYKGPGRYHRRCLRNIGARYVNGKDRILTEAQDEFERRSSNWNGLESGHDMVSTFTNAGKKKEWVRFRKELVSIESDYGDTVAVANPSPVFDPTVP
ncbi:uncharacterized protein [Physcomitrium patens]|uniref:uncharacterized protein isoform X1 n=1 Tax=Physcomitrium patens TaxID=3218 RepID=UPI000D15551D|nr:uncharacterized protein LOC112295781 isoform X1 [Physcomitrium patens]|eukprot:XP_024403497.1 uncharacterized protein LOC112295781 isoform X1 [Physcomitrella patens]